MKRYPVMTLRAPNGVIKIAGANVYPNLIMLNYLVYSQCLL